VSLIVVFAVACGGEQAAEPEPAWNEARYAVNDMRTKCWDVQPGPWTRTIGVVAG
jgi:hypothetical protein